MTDALQAISDNTAMSALYLSEGKVGKHMARRWVDFDKPEPLEDTRSPEEVTKHMLSLLRGETK